MKSVCVWGGGGNEPEGGREGGMVLGFSSVCGACAYDRYDVC